MGDQSCSSMEECRSCVGKGSIWVKLFNKTQCCIKNLNTLRTPIIAIARNMDKCEDDDTAGVNLWVLGFGVCAAILFAACGIFYWKCKGWSGRSSGNTRGGDPVTALPMGLLQDRESGF